MKITKIGLTGAAALRLRALGFGVGSEVTVLAFSFFKSSVLVGCGNVRLGLRKRVAERIEVQRLPSFRGGQDAAALHKGVRT